MRGEDACADQSQLQVGPRELPALLLIADLRSFGHWGGACLSHNRPNLDNASPLLKRWGRDPQV